MTQAELTKLIQKQNALYGTPSTIRAIIAYLRASQGRVVRGGVPPRIIRLLEEYAMRRAEVEYGCRRGGDRP